MENGKNTQDWFLSQPHSAQEHCALDAIQGLDGLKLSEQTLITPTVCHVAAYANVTPRCYTNALRSSLEGSDGAKSWTPQKTRFGLHSGPIQLRT